LNNILGFYYFIVNDQYKTKLPSSSTPTTSPTKSKLEDSFIGLASKKQMLTHKLSNVATTVHSKASALSSNISKYYLRTSTKISVYSLLYKSKI